MHRELNCMLLRLKAVKWDDGFQGVCVLHKDDVIFVLQLFICEEEFRKRWYHARIRFARELRMSGSLIFREKVNLREKRKDGDENNWEKPNGAIFKLSSKKKAWPRKWNMVSAAFMVPNWLYGRLSAVKARVQHQVDYNRLIASSWNIWGSDNQKASTEEIHRSRTNVNAFVAVLIVITGGLPREVVLTRPGAILLIWEIEWVCRNSRKRNWEIDVRATDTVMKISRGDRDMKWSVFLRMLEIGKRERSWKGEVAKSQHRAKVNKAKPW